MTECETKPGADEVGERAQAAAEERLHACWEALQKEDDGDERPAWPETAAPFCGCDTCVIRETLAAAWPLLVEAARIEGGLDVQRIALRPGDTVLVSSERHLTGEQADRIKAVVKDTFPDHKTIVMDGSLTISAVGRDDEDEVPVPAIVE